MPHPTTTLALKREEIERVIVALHESASDREQWDEVDEATAFVTLEQKFLKAHHTIIRSSQT